MKFLELFAGIGGFRRGLEELGHECVGWVEWDKYARKSYEAIWPSAREEWTANDITTVTDESLRELARRIGQVDLIAFGFPCQAFSVAGKRGGFEDTRGTLFFEAARFAMVLRPKLLLAENVVGLLNHDEGRTFYTILCALDELGYDTEWQVCNAKDFGIPQNRERVFIVGHLRAAGGRKVFPLRETNNQTAAELKCVGMLDIKGQDAIRRVYSPTGISPTLTTMAGGNREPKIIDTRQHIDSRIGKGPRVYEDGVCPTISASDYKEPKQVIVSAVNDCGREKKTQNDRRIKEPEEPMFTLTGQDRHGVMVIQKTHGATTTLNYDQTGTLQAARLDKVPCVKVVGNTNPSGNGMNGNVFDADGLAPTVTTNKDEGNKILTNARIRKLTPKECWRLMGRQDWEFERAKQAGVSDSQLYKQAGNSLVPQIVTEIAKNFDVDALEEST